MKKFLITTVTVLTFASSAIAGNKVSAVPASTLVDSAGNTVTTSEHTPVSTSADSAPLEAAKAPEQKDTPKKDVTHKASHKATKKTKASVKPTPSK